MSTTIKFFNNSNKLITEQQAGQLDSFSKHFFENGIFKKKEVYRENVLWGGIYCLSPGENVTNVLTQLDPQLNWSIRSNKQIVNGYTVWESRFYFENLQQEPKYSKLVFDSQGNEIATVGYDSITNQSKGAFKVFNFGNQQIPWDNPGYFFEPDAAIYFSFSDDGNIESIQMNYDLVNNESYWTNLNKFLADADFIIQELFTPEQIYYFTHVEPLVPNF